MLDFKDVLIDASKLRSTLKHEVSPALCEPFVFLHPSLINNITKCEEITRDISPKAGPRQMCFLFTLAFNYSICPPYI